MRAVAKRATPLEFFVPGKPVTQGSHRPFTYRRKDGGIGAGVDNDNKRTRPWKSAVASAALFALAGEPKFSEQALEVRAVFGLERPKGHYRTGRNSHLVRSSAPELPSTQPDLDKLQRAVGDALEGIVYEGDSRIVRWDPVKIYVPRGMVTGVAIRVAPIGGEEIEWAEDEYQRLLKAARYAGTAGGVSLDGHFEG